jgi:hypothetical protein
MQQTSLHPLAVSLLLLRTVLTHPGLLVRSHFSRLLALIVASVLHSLVSQRGNTFDSMPSVFSESNLLPQVEDRGNSAQMTD